MKLEYTQKLYPIGEDGPHGTMMVLDTISLQKSFNFRTQMQIPIQIILLLFAFHDGCRVGWGILYSAVNANRFTS